MPSHWMPAALEEGGRFEIPFEVPIVSVIGQEAAVPEATVPEAGVMAAARTSSDRRRVATR